MGKKVVNIKTNFRYFVPTKKLETIFEWIHHVLQYVNS